MFCIKPIDLDIVSYSFTDEADEIVLLFFKANTLIWFDFFGTVFTQSQLNCMRREYANPIAVLYH